MPSEDEVIEAMGQLKGNKAGGKNGLLPESVKSYGANILENLCNLYGTVWNEEKIPGEWRDALLVPIPKKGDLSLCDNWRGISLLDVVGKLFARVMQLS